MKNILAIIFILVIVTNLNCNKKQCYPNFYKLPDTDRFNLRNGDTVIFKVNTNSNQVHFDTSYVEVIFDTLTYPCTYNLNLVGGFYEKQQVYYHFSNESNLIFNVFFQSNEYVTEFYYLSQLNTFCQIPYMYFQRKNEYEINQILYTNVFYSDSCSSIKKLYFNKNFGLISYTNLDSQAVFELSKINPKK